MKYKITLIVETSTDNLKKDFENKSFHQAIEIGVLNSPVSGELLLDCTIEELKE